MDDLTDTRHINRLEIVDTGRRRRWSVAEKLRIVEESFSGPRLASATARRHGISNQLLFAWRKAYREGQLGDIRGSGTRILDLTSRASREPANRLYQKLGFKLRDTLVYREPRDCTDRAGGDLKLRAARPSATGSRDRTHPNGKFRWHSATRIIFVKNVKAKPSSHRSRAPGFLRILVTFERKGKRPQRCNRPSSLGHALRLDPSDVPDS